ncbi:MAG: ATP cone domain-containing protein [Candidatus Saccharimonadales bacterium]
MVCIYCGHKTVVANSRSKKKNAVVWRRRLCTHCGAITTTFEEYDYSTALVVKKRSGALQAFQKDKLLLSIAKATEHRQGSTQAASELTTTIISRILKQKPIQTTILSKDISSVASLVLKHYDAASAVKYLSFQAPTNLSRDIRKMLQ